MSSWYVYILHCADNSLYIGISTDVEKRLKCHNDGSGAKYTRSRLPVSLVWQEGVPSESLARKREAALKKLKRAEKLALIQTGVVS